MTAPSRVEVLRTGPGQAPSFVEADPDSLGDQDLVARIVSGELGGVVVRGAMAPTRAAAAVEALRQAPGDSGPVDAAPFPGWTYGAVLVVSPPDLRAYLTRARGLEAALAAAGLDLGAELLATLCALGAGRAVRVPHAPDGQAYAAVTVRALAPGQGVAVHSERADWPSMAGLVGQVDPHHQLSCYVPLALGEGGGELLIYHRPPPGQEPALGELRQDLADGALLAFGLTVVRPRVGDLLLFDGGRYNHRVTPCTRGERWTVGCFLSPGMQGPRLAWS